MLTARRAPGRGVETCATDGLDPRVDAGHRGDHAAAVARSPDADALGVDAGLALQERDGSAEVRDLVHVVQVRALQQQPYGFLGDRAVVGRGVGLEQPEVVRPAAAEAVALIVDRHRHQPAVGKTRRVLFRSRSRAH